MNKLLMWLLIIFVIFVFIIAVRWYVLMHIKLGLEAEFYSTAIEYMKKEMGE